MSNANDLFSDENRNTSTGTSIQTQTDSEEIPSVKTGNAKKKVKITRKAAEIFGLGKSISIDDAEITGSRLPTYSQVIRCYMYYQQFRPGETKYKMAQQVYNQLILFYSKGNIPMIKEGKGCEKILKVVQNNAKLRAIPSSRRAQKHALEKVEKENLLLTKTFPLWPNDAETLIANEEDLKFLKSMQTDRIASFGGLDQNQVRKFKRHKEKEEAVKRRKEKAAQTQKDIEEKAELLSSTEESSLSGTNERLESSSETEVENLTDGSSTQKHRKRKAGTGVFAYRDVMKSKRLTSLAARLKMTPAQQSIYTKKLVEVCGGDSSKLNLSYSYVDKSRRKTIEQIATACKEQWVPPKFASLHWDSKLLPTLNNPNILEQRLTVSVGTHQATKLLGTPAYPAHSSGDRQAGKKVAELTMELIETWNCCDSIVNMVFDTTASNTGHLTAACICVQEKLGRALLWSGCRHHVGEIILAQIFKDLKIETSKSPDIAVFLRFRKQFDVLNRNVNMMDISSMIFDEQVASTIEEWKTNSLMVLQGDFIPARDDYKELIQLCCKFLGRPVSFTLKRPGALHKARWMAKLLYAFKICLLEPAVNELSPKTIATKQQISQLRRFVTFSALIYCPWWFTCMSAIDAPHNDLQFVKSIFQYAAVDELVSNSAKKAILRHLWYLTPEMIPMALFSDLVSNSEKKEMAKRLLVLKPQTPITCPLGRYGTSYGKPNFPSDITETTSLSELITQDSWFFFQIFEINSEFLHENAAVWSDMGSYQQSLENIDALNVVNDSAERAVKLTTDFLPFARSENTFQHILQVVESNRSKTTNIRKSSKQ